VLLDMALQPRPENVVIACLNGEPNAAIRLNYPAFTPPRSESSSGKPAI